MELDSRIIDGKRPLSVIDIEQANGFIGQNGFFADAINRFDDLSSCPCGKLVNVEDNKMFPFECNDKHKYIFFIPEKWVKEPEKKYRPYKNVQELFEDIGVYIGDTIHFRSKAKGTESHSLITSYTTLKDGTEKICLGGAFYYTMQDLFDSFELRSRGEWHKFGVEE